jgi:hypothetical protein
MLSGLSCGGKGIRTTLKHHLRLERFLQKKISNLAENPADHPTFAYYRTGSKKKTA